MRRKNGSLPPVIRYSEAFKREVVRELERSDCPVQWVQRKYRIGSVATVSNWIRKYGNGTRGKVIRVQKPEEFDEVKRLKKELRLVKQTLADAHVALSLEKSFLEIACEGLGQSVEDFKKKQDGSPRTVR